MLYCFVYRERRVSTLATSLGSCGLQIQSGSINLSLNLILHPIDPAASRTLPHSRTRDRGRQLCRPQLIWLRNSTHSSVADRQQNASYRARELAHCMCMQQAASRFRLRSACDRTTGTGCIGMYSHSLPSPVPLINAR